MSSFSNLLHQINSCHSKSEDLKKERDNLKVSLDKANRKIAELETTLAKYRAKDIVVEKERYVLSQLINIIHKELVQDDPVSKKIDKIEKDVLWLSNAIEKSIADLEKRCHYTDYVTSQRTLNDLEKTINGNEDHSEIDDCNILCDDEPSSTYFDDELKSSLLQETYSHLNEKSFDSPTSEIISMPASGRNRTLSTDEVTKFQPLVDKNKLVLRDILSSWLSWHQNGTHPDDTTFNLFSNNEVSSSMITSSSNFSFQNCAATEIDFDGKSILQGNSHDSFQSIAASSKSEHSNQITNFFPTKESIGQGKIFAEPPPGKSRPDLVLSTYKIPSKVRISPSRYNLRQRKFVTNYNALNGSPIKYSSSGRKDSHLLNGPNSLHAVEHSAERENGKTPLKSSNYLSAVGRITSDFAVPRTPIGKLRESKFSSSVNGVGKHISEYEKQCLICKNKKDQDNHVSIFLTYRDLDQHIMENHSKPYPTYKRCPYKEEKCERHFTSMDQLRTHVLLLHQKQNRTFPSEKQNLQRKCKSCQFCDEIFTCSSDLKNHVNKEHFSSTNTSTVRSVCQVCKYVANSSKTVKMHKLKCQKKRIIYKNGNFCAKKRNSQRN